MKERLAASFDFSDSWLFNLKLDLKFTINCLKIEMRNYLCNYNILELELEWVLISD